MTKGLQVNPLESIADLKRLNRSIGQHWFSPDTLAFFDSIIESGLITPGRVTHPWAYFITSEQPPGEKRRYSIRKTPLTGQYRGLIENHGEFLQYATGKEAAAALQAEFKFTRDPLTRHTAKHLG